MKKPNAILLVALCVLSRVAYPQNSLMSNFGEVSALYLGTCYGIEYLQQAKCRSIVSQLPSNCQKKVVQLLPDKFKSELDQVMSNSKNELRRNATEAVEIGFKKVMGMTNNDLEKSCAGYGASLNTFAFSQYEELKRISKFLK